MNKNILKKLIYLEYILLFAGLFVGSYFVYCFYIFRSSIFDSKNIHPVIIEYDHYAIGFGVGTLIATTSITYLLMITINLYRRVQKL